MSKRFAIKMPGWLIIVLVIVIPLIILYAGRWYLLQPRPTYHLPPDIPVEKDGRRIEPTQTGKAGDAPDESPQLVRSLEDLEKRFTHAASEGRSLLVIRQAVSDLVDEHPDSHSAHRLLGLVHLEDGRIQQAYKHLSRSLELYPEQAEVSLTAGTVAVKLGRLDIAREHYSKALSMSAQSNRYLLHMAQLELHENHIDEARAIADDMLSRNTRAHRGHALVSGIAVKEGNVDEGLEHLQTAIENTPLTEQDIQLKYQQQKVKLLREAGRLDDAIAVLRSLLFSHGEDPQILHEAALTWAELGEYAAAAQLYEKALEERPQDLRLVIGAARWSIVAGRLDEARGHILTLKNLHPHSPQLATLQSALEEARENPAGPQS